MKALIPLLLIIALSPVLNAQVEDRPTKEVTNSSSKRLGDPIPDIDITIDQAPGGAVKKPVDNIYLLDSFADIKNIRIDLGESSRKMGPNRPTYELHLVAYDQAGQKVGESKSRFKGGSLPLAKSLRKCCKSLEDVVTIHATVSMSVAEKKTLRTADSDVATVGIPTAASETIIFKQAR